MGPMQCDLWYWGVCTPEICRAASQAWWAALPRAQGVQVVRQCKELQEGVLWLVMIKCGEKCESVCEMV